MFLSPLLCAPCFIKPKLHVFLGTFVCTDNTFQICELVDVIQWFSMDFNLHHRSIDVDDIGFPFADVQT